MEKKRKERECYCTLPAWFPVEMLEKLQHLKVSFYCDHTSLHKLILIKNAVNPATVHRHKVKWPTERKCRAVSTVGSFLSSTILSSSPDMSQ